MSELPPLSTLLATVRSSDDVSHSDTSSIRKVLPILLETSPALPALVTDFTENLASAKDTELPATYEKFIDQALDIVRSWERERQASFIGGHPRIGEVKGLSVMSAAEQGQATGITTTPAPTPPEVLARLEFLNAAYERRYPGLVYITFVNGRSRTQIRAEMEDKLAKEGVLPGADETGGLDKVVPWTTSSDVWLGELSRAIDDIGKIAKSRLRKLGAK